MSVTFQCKSGIGGTYRSVTNIVIHATVHTGSANDISDTYSSVTSTILHANIRVGDVTGTW